jgi:hypothetical protein
LPAFGRLNSQVSGGKVGLKRKLLAWSVAITAPLLFAAPSAAHADASQCPGNAFCLWQDSNGNGIMVWAPLSLGGQPDLRSWSFNDIASSVGNKSDRNACIYQDINYQGPVLVVPPHAFYNLPGNVNDAASSFKWC